jgi:hypothetical protein
MASSDNQALQTLKTRVKITPSSGAAFFLNDGGGAAVAHSNPAFEAPKQKAAPKQQAAPRPAPAAAAPRPAPVAARPAPAATVDEDTSDDDWDIDADA